MLVLTKHPSSQSLKAATLDDPSSPAIPFTGDSHTPSSSAILSMGRDGYNGPNPTAMCQHLVRPAASVVVSNAMSTSHNMASSSTSAQPRWASSRSPSGPGCVNRGRDDGRDGYN